MRLFIAINLSKEIIDELERLQKKLEGKLNLPKQFHLTLKFLGEVKNLTFLQKLSEIKFEPFEISLNKISFFPNEKQPRIIWVGVKPEKQVIELQQKIETLITPNHEPQTANQFHPHITIARIKKLENKDEIKKLKITPLIIKISSFKIFKSILTSQGAIHEVLREFKND